VATLRELREQLIREYFPRLTDLRTQVQITYWSENHLIPQPLLAILPFGRTLGTSTFNSYITWQRPEIVEASRRSLLYWSLVNNRSLPNLLAEQTTLFHDDTFFWHYYVPAKNQEIVESIQNGNRIRFLSRFHLSQTQIELEFSEIQLLTTSTPPQLVYTDSEDHTYTWSRQAWEVTILNRNQTSLDPQEFVIPVGPNPFGRETQYQETLAQLLEYTDDLRVDPHYWDSLSTTPAGDFARTRVNTPSTPPPGLTPASPIPSEPVRAHISFVPTCLCGIDLCECDYKYPDTPPTPPSVFLWKPREERRPIAGLHYQHHRNSLQSG